MRVRAMLLVASLLVASACQPQRDSPVSGSASGAADNDAAVRTSIDEANARFRAALEKGDTATMIANYADDADFLMAGAPAIKGRAAIGKTFGEMLSQVMIMSPRTITDDLIVKDDIAIETGHYEWMMHPKAGGAAITDKGKYITVWRRQADGTWKIIKDINNSDAPAK